MAVSLPAGSWGFRATALLILLPAASGSAQTPQATPRPQRRPAAPSYTDTDLQKLSPTTPSPAPRPSPEAQADPVAAFAADWKDRGRRLAATSPWLSQRRILIAVEPGIGADIAPLVGSAVREQLAELGATRLRVENGGVSSSFAQCITGNVLDTHCFGTAVDRWRGREARAAGSILFGVTAAGLGSLPTTLPSGHGYGPPAGVASWPDGWVALSEYYLRLNSARLEPRVWTEFSDHARAQTVKHELVHLLGLPHHQALGNPGLPEPPEGDACRHLVGPLPGAECLMRCGSGDDDWGHIKTHGRSFGLCARCRLAAESALAGIEGR